MLYNKVYDFSEETLKKSSHFYDVSCNCKCEQQCWHHMTYGASGTVSNLHLRSIISGGVLSQSPDSTALK